MSDNVKIVIQEEDTTSPLGAGTSSDIVFVPGFSSKFDAVKNTPVLCNTIAEFEKYFGKTPRYLTDNDVDGYEEYGYRVGDYDRSYIYAKELLNQDMSVIYANMDSRTSTLINLTSSNPTATEGKFCISANEELKDTITLNGTYTIAVAGVNSAAPNVPVKSYFEYAPLLTMENTDRLSITKFTVDTDFEDTLSVKRISTSNNVIAFESLASSSTNIEIKFEIELHPNKFGLGASASNPEIALLSIHEFTTSVLASLYGGLSDVLKQLKDRSEFSVKYITTGGYPAAVIDTSKTDGSIVDKLGTIIIDCAADRGDAVALVDYMMTADEQLYSVGKSANNNYESVYAKMHNCYGSVANASYGAAFYPWGIYNCANTLASVDVDNMNVLMPASFGYMMCVATAIKTSPNWLAMAGVARGVVPNLKSLYTKNTLTNVIAEEFQPKFGAENHSLSINAITNVRPYGLTVWGNRTMMPVDPKGTKALNFLNTRNMVSDIKKVLYTTAKSLMFEQDSDTLWLKFKSGITPLLNQLVGGNGISDYKVIRTKTKYDGSPLTRGEMAATIKIFPLYAIEYFELTVQISDQDVTVE